MGCTSSRIEYVNIESIKNTKIENNKYYNIIIYFNGLEQHVILNEKEEKKLQTRFKYHKMYREISQLKYYDIKEITNFEIIDKDNKNNEEYNYSFIINYKDELMMTKIKLNKFQLKFFLSMLKINKVKCNVDKLKEYVK
jgi:hypothetical protein